LEQLKQIIIIKKNIKELIRLVNFYSNEISLSPEYIEMIPDPQVVEVVKLCTTYMTTRFDSLEWVRSSSRRRM
jgi:hypothetical protein